MRRRVLSASTLVLSTAMVAACGEVEGGFERGGEGETEIILVEQAWEDLMVENQIVRQVLEDAGYTVTIEDLSVPLGAQALVKSDADAYLGNWWPSQRDVFGEHIDAGNVDVLGTLVEGTSYEPAVPEYVAERHDVTSLADLDSEADAFDSQFLGIEAGTPGNKAIQNAIDDDAYGLGDWELIESSTPTMLGEVEERVNEERPVVFLAWEPHWMNIEWDLVYLEDPDDAWPGAGEIRIATRKGFEEDNPNVARFLSQVTVDRETASEWVYSVSHDDTSPEDVARAWIEENPDTIDAWLDGIETTDGDPAEVSS